MYHTKAISGNPQLRHRDAQQKMEGKAPEMTLEEMNVLMDEFLLKRDVLPLSQVP